MRVAVLSDTLVRGVRISRHIDGCSGTCWIVLCPPGNRSSLARVLRELWNFLGSPSLIANMCHLLARLAAGRVILLRHPLDDESSIWRLRRFSFDVGLHNAGVIYRKPAIDAFRLGILNAHIGWLPEFRGRAVMEWSILTGAPTGVTVFFIDEGIDTGPRIVLRRKVSVATFSQINAAKNHLFQQDAALYRDALTLLRNANFVHEENHGGHRYYPMSRLFLGVVEGLMREMSGYAQGRDRLAEEKTPEMTRVCQ